MMLLFGYQPMGDVQARRYFERCPLCAVPFAWSQRGIDHNISCHLCQLYFSCTATYGPFFALSGISIVRLVYRGKELLPSAKGASTFLRDKDVVLGQYGDNLSTVCRNLDKLLLLQ